MRLLFIAGYGNQTPSFELSRFVACCVMIFGKVFFKVFLLRFSKEVFVLQY